MEGMEHCDGTVQEHGAVVFEFAEGVADNQMGWLYDEEWAGDQHPVERDEYCVTVLRSALATAEGRLRERRRGTA